MNNIKKYSLMAIVIIASPFIVFYGLYLLMGIVAGAFLLAMLALFLGVCWHIVVEPLFNKIQTKETK